MACDKNKQKIKTMFDEISDYYDLMNNFISLGTHHIVKFLALRELNIQPRTMILDLCCGTGDISRLINKFYPRTKVIGLDFSQKMLKFAKIKNPKGVFMQADCTNLPFGDGEFDYITMSFGLRNIENRGQALDEIYRVLNSNGKFLHLDFGYHNIMSKIFNIVVPLLAKILKKNTEHYKYLINSKEEFSNPDALIHEFEQHGFKYVKKRDYLFGVISAQIMMK